MSLIRMSQLSRNPFFWNKRTPDLTSLSKSKSGILCEEVTVCLIFQQACIVKLETIHTLSIKDFNLSHCIAIILVNSTNT